MRWAGDATRRAALVFWRIWDVQGICRWARHATGHARWAWPIMRWAGEATRRAALVFWRIWDVWGMRRRAWHAAGYAWWALERKIGHWRWWAGW